VSKGPVVDPGAIAEELGPPVTALIELTAVGVPFPDATTTRVVGDSGEDTVELPTTALVGIEVDCVELFGMTCSTEDATDTC
jgi:hypothetical protein